MIANSEKPVQIIIRTDASVEIGTGHVMRCLTLASGLTEGGAHVGFLCRAHDGNLIDLIKRSGFEVKILPASTLGNFQSKSISDPVHAAWLGCDWQSDVQQCRSVLSHNIDWLIVDHYALDHKWEREMRSTCQNIMVIDDLADRSHDCDLLLDQSIGRTASDYLEFVGAETRMLLGPQYALLRPEFAQWRVTSLAHRQSPELRHILVTMGGVDRDNVTERVLTGLHRCRLPTLEKITVVMGLYAPWHDAVIAAAAGMKIQTVVLSDVDQMAELMSTCDLAIGAGGTTTLERCSLGLPSVLLILADNQLNIVEHMVEADAAFAIGDLDSLETSLVEFLESFALSNKMAIYAQNSSDLLDANGVVRTIAKLLGHNG